jgi:hypothetical protein
MSALATMKKTHGLWAEGKLQDMANCWDKTGTLKLLTKAWPEFNRIFSGPAGVMDWIALIHKRFVFHDHHFEDYTESADKSVANCSFTNYITDSSTGKKQMNKFSQKIRIDTETGLIKTNTFSVTSPDETFGSTTLYGCVRAVAKLKKDSRQAAEQKLQEILPEVYRIEGVVSATGYFEDDETYISYTVYDTIEKAHAAPSDPNYIRLFAEFGDLITSHTQSVSEAFWAGSHMATQSKTFAAVSNIHLKQGARNILLKPNDLVGKMLQFPGFIGVLQVLHNDNFLEGVAIYSTEEHAKGAAELAKPLMAEMINHLAALPERKIYPAFSLSGCDGFQFLMDVTFADQESMDDYSDFIQHEEGESNFFWFSTGELSMRGTGCYSSSQYAKLVARLQADQERLLRGIGSITKCTGIWTGATGTADAVLAGWNAFPQISLNYAKPILASNITTANVNADGAFAYINDIECVEGKRDEFNRKLAADLDGTRFDLLSGTRQETGIAFNKGVNSCTSVSYTNKAAFLRKQATYQTLAPNFFTTEYVKHCTVTVVSTGPPDADVKTAMDVWDALDWITINYVTADPSSLLKF